MMFLDTLELREKSSKQLNIKDINLNYINVWNTKNLFINQFGELLINNNNYLNSSNDILRTSSQNAWICFKLLDVCNISLLSIKFCGNKKSSKVKKTVFTRFLHVNFKKLQRSIDTLLDTLVLDKIYLRRMDYQN